MQLIVLFILAYAIKAALEDARKGWRTSKSAYMRSADARFPRMPRPRRAAHALRHDAGYWAAQALHGFPTARHGLAYGWHEGRRETAERRAAREQAKAERLEAEAVLAPHVAGYRERQQAAREAAREARRPAGAGRDGSAGMVRERIIDDIPGDARTWSWGASRSPYHWPSPGGPGPAHRQARHMSTGGMPYDVCWYPPGGGRGVIDATYLGGSLYLPDPDERAVWDGEAAWQREDDRAYGRVRFPDDGTTWTAETTATSPAGQPERLAITQGEGAAREYEAEAAAIRDGFEFEDCEVCGTGLEQHLIAPDALGHAHAWCPDGTAGAEQDSPPTQGGTPVSDVTYDGVISAMSAAVARAEGSAAEQQQAGQQASAMADQAQALGVDPATLSAMADHLDAHDAAARALLRVQETAETVRAELERGHAGLKQAHDDAPVTAAATEFYAG